MKRVVIDASVALAWLFRDEASELANGILERAAQLELLVPSHWPLEVANALLVAERRGRTTAEETDELLSLLAAIRVRIDAETVHHAFSRTLDLARSRSLTTYDAAYLELALRRGCPLATLDARLADAARWHALPTFDPHLR